MARKLYNMIFIIIVLLAIMAFGVWFAVELIPEFHFAWPTVVLTLTYSIALVLGTVLALFAIADYQNERWKAEQLEKAKADKGWQNYTDTWKEVETLCKDCSAWSGTDCTRNPYTDDCLKNKGGKDE